MATAKKSPAKARTDVGSVADMDLKALKVGDQVSATYVQELGLAVDPAPTPSLNLPQPSGGHHAG